MKVLHYIPSFSVTTETFIYDQVVALERSGIESAVLTAKRLNVHSRPFDKVYTAPIKSIINPRITQAFALRLQLLPFMIDYKTWARVIEEFKPDVIHCHTGNAVKTWMHVNDKLGFNIPTLASLHGSDVNSEPLIRPKYRAVLEEAGKKPFIKWTVPSAFLKQKCMLNLGTPENKISVVHNAFNPIFLAEQQKKALDELRIISVGRFIGCKGHTFLIDAFSLLLNRYPNATLTLVGGGELESQLKAQAEALNIDQKITFIEQVQHAQLPKLLASHNVYVQPSIRDEITFQEESFGVAALEAMAVGLATVVSECGGLTELATLTDTNAVAVVPQKDASAIATAVGQLFDRQACLSSFERDKVGALFSSQTNTSAILTLFNQLVSEK
ncbi:glycosyltransferase [Pseudoalteromonas sp. McH1-7]|uniref:glycosyltransferase n=1 Tax=unclassified Pseudoalteromonas TaxID=194690 RepID=UPI0015918328|nr:MULTISPECIES: glycosyltransferase [unclassified Pseudoalteromonas]NUZ10682.1 glycosyltransferase [Pseudoalteromonas sp. McH1-7]USD29069.1 glycosyltransferase [Pseudoalteromonas sp. SCSIO 43201]